MALGGPSALVDLEGLLDLVGLGGHSEATRSSCCSRPVDLLLLEAGGPGGPQCLKPVDLVDLGFRGSWAWWTLVPEASGPQAGGHCGSKSMDPMDVSV